MNERFACLQLAHKFASDEQEIIAIAESFLEWIDGEVVIVFTQDEAREK